jgi:RNA polymerase sigma factor (sigma-70 family)
MGTDSPAPDVRTRPSIAAANGTCTATDEPVRVTAAPFAEVYERYARLLRVIAVRDFHVPFGDAEAIVHDIFLCYFAHPGVVRGDVKAYLCSAVRNGCIDYLRKRGRERAVFEDVEDVPADSTLPDRVAVRLAMAETMARLRPRCRDALRCFHLENKSSAVVAAELNASPTYVRQLLHHCRKAARQIFEELTRVTP